MSAQIKEHGAASSAARKLIRRSFGMSGPFAMGRGTAVAIETNDKGTAMATDHLTRGEAPISRIGLRRFSFPMLLMLLCVSASMTFAADAMSQSADFDIAPQAMESALHEWSRQSNVQVMVASQDVSGQRTDGLKGRHTAASVSTPIEF